MERTSAPHSCPSQRHFITCSRQRAHEQHDQRSPVGVGLHAWSCLPAFLGRDEAGEGCERGRRAGRGQERAWTSSCPTWKHLQVHEWPFLCEIGQGRKEILGELIGPCWCPPWLCQLAPRITQGECGAEAVPGRWDGCNSLFYLGERRGHMPRHYTCLRGSRSLV